MKRNVLRLLMTIVVTFVVLSVSAKKKACADLTLTDGTVIENVELELPNFWGINFKYTVNGEKVKIKSDNIDHMIVWHESTPDSKAYMKQMAYGEFKHKTGEYKVNEKRTGWYMLVSSGEHLAYWIAFWQVKVKDKGFEFKLGDSPSGYGGTPYFFQRSGDKVAYKIAYDAARPGLVRDWLIAFLSDDPELVKKITDKGYFSRRQARRYGPDYNPFLFEEIALDYNPAK